LEQLTKAEFNALIDQPTILEKDGYGAKVLLSNDDKIIKIFRRKRNISSAVFSPYAQRFKNNAEKLTQLGIITVAVERIAYCQELKKHLIIYPLLAGHTLRELLQEQYSASLIKQLGGFIAQLHERGIYFRSLHLGNILLTEHKQLALIDVADLRITKKPLSINLRVRNFAHFFRYPQDKQHLVEYGIDKFFTHYLEQANKPALSLERLLAVAN
jgi:tRNA A-37 threonylcarbamoyl transferase component Bud32